MSRHVTTTGVLLIERPLHKHEIQLLRQFYAVVSAVPTCGEVAAVMMGQICEDITAGIVPATVGTFEELHDHLDANMYADEFVRMIEQSGRAWADFINGATDIVDVWLRAGRPADIAMQHAATSWHEPTPIYLGELADTLPVRVQRTRAQLCELMACLPTLRTSAGLNTVGVSPFGPDAGPLPGFMY
ncbi:hypothetical protein AB0C34_17370 [Nocardia sp. NPDC049220]|uniref:hypothetical protein n=1 Tax=Nocardia sp. NPDC049220 TaxID=3155273 RepID=UPI0034065F22